MSSQLREAQSEGYQLAQAALASSRLANDEPSQNVKLERGEIICFHSCPFSLPEGDELAFLHAQRSSAYSLGGITFEPGTGRILGLARESPEQEERLREILARFCRNALAWSTSQLPAYSTGWEIDRASFRPEEEAIRAACTSARDDLVHIDACADRPSQGRRLMKLCANANLTDPCVWVTSEPFAVLLARFGKEVGLPSLRRRSWWEAVLAGAARLRQHRSTPRSAYDSFMLRMHNFLKSNEKFQERCPKRYWKFAPGSAWLAMTDAASHAVVRGQYTLELSFLVPPSVLAVPEEAPAALLAKATGQPIVHEAAEEARTRADGGRIVLAGKIEGTGAVHEISHPLRHW